MTFRVAVGQISCESNSFATFTCDLDTVRKTGYLYEGDDVLQLRDKDNEVGGMIKTLEEADDVEVVPLLASRWNSSAIVTFECFSYLKSHLLARLEEVHHLDGVLLSCHGSMVVKGLDDPEGELGQAVRDFVGPKTPIAMTLDLHGNVTQQMVESVGLILGYKEYPHDDPYTTGVRAAALLLKTMRGEVRPVTACVRLPMILTGFHGSTKGDGPFAQVMNQAKALENEAGVLSTSLQYVGSYIDIPDIGCTALVIADGDQERAVREAKRIAEDFWSRRAEFLVKTISVEEAVRRGRTIRGGPVILLDTADAAGGGAPGDSIDLVKGLLEAGVTEPSLAMVVDPDGVQACSAAGLGSEVTVELGHAVDPRWGEPYRVSGRVLRLSDGRFQYTGGILGGTWASMGPSVVLQVGSIQLLVQTQPTYDWRDEQYRSVQMNPEKAKFVGAKNMMNFRNAYGDIMKGAYVLDIPGPTAPDMRALPYQRAKRPLYPWDDNLEHPDMPIWISS